MISTKGRYAVRVIVDLSESNPNQYTSMKEIAVRQELSVKYLERIIPALTKAGLVEGAKGKTGGYKLSKSPKEITVGEILRLTEKDMAPVACLSKRAVPCPRRQKCKTISMWESYQKLTNQFFDNITIADLCLSNPKSM